MRHLPLPLSTCPLCRRNLKQRPSGTACAIHLQRPLVPAAVPRVWRFRSQSEVPGRSTPTSQALLAQRPHSIALSRGHEGSGQVQVRDLNERISPIAPRGAPPLPRAVRRRPPSMPPYALELPRFRRYAILHLASEWTVRDSLKCGRARESCYPDAKITKSGGKSPPLGLTESGAERWISLLHYSIRIGFNSLPPRAAVGGLRCHGRCPSLLQS
jgi:hypothetical protein